MNIIKPTFVLHQQRCKRNIEKMQWRAQQADCILRPHFKTHQSATVGQWFLDAGINQCTVSSVDMAEYFAHNGWHDILIAFPFNILELEKLKLISEEARVIITVESKEVVEFLGDNIDFSLDFRIKIDAGYGRTGVNAKAFDEIDEIVDASKTSSLLKFTGFIQHAGHTYKVKGKKAVDEIHNTTTQQMLALKDRYQPAYPGLLISSGDTPTASLSDYSALDEMRAGNFVYYDVMQAEIGACEYQEVACTIACPVVAKHEERLEIVLYGGAVHFSKDTIQRDGKENFYGYYAGKQEKSTFREGFNKEVYLTRLSQEHGIVKAPKDFIQNTNIGDVLHFYPIHSCLAANLMIGNSEVF